MQKLATAADYAAEDDDTAADSSDDIPSRTGLKMSSELRVEARRQEELKKTKKTESAKPPPPSSERDEEQGKAAEPSLPATPSNASLRVEQNLLRHLAAKSRQQEQ